MSSGERWYLLILVELLTITQWVEVRGDFCWYWWNCWQSVNEFRREVFFVDIGGIVVHHSMNWCERWFLLILVELLTITQWVEVRYDCCWYWWNCWPSLNEFRWEVILLILVELLTITQWVELRGDFCWYWWNCWPSLNELMWEVIFVDIGDGQQFHQYQQKSPLNSTHWVMVNNSTNINKNHLSHQLIEWWSTIPPISTKITSHLNTLSDGQQFHQYQQKSPLTSTHWVTVNNSTNINKNHLSPQLIEWWSTIPPISTKITSHLNSLSDGQQFHQYQQNHLSPITHWVIVNNSTNINNNHHSPQLIKWWSTIPPISTKITSHLITLSGIVDHHSMSWSERWCLLILVELLTITQWVE